MTDRLKGCWVAFESDIRVDDAKQLLNAIRAIRGVAGVEGSVVDHSDWMARQHVRTELAEATRKLFNEIFQTEM